MEAASVPAAGSAGAEAAEGAAAGAEGQQEGEQQGGLDLGPLMEHLDSRFEQFEQGFEERYGGEEGEQEGEEGFEGAEDGELDLEALYDEDGEVDPDQALAVLSHLADQRAEAKVQEQLAPVMEVMNELRNAHNATALTTQYPELKDPQAAGELMQRAQETAERLGLDEEDALAFAQNPGYLELVLKAGKAEQLASGELAEGRSELGLESGATAGQGSANTNAARDVVSAGGPSGFWT